MLSINGYNDTVCGTLRARNAVLLFVSGGRGFSISPVQDMLNSILHYISNDSKGRTRKIHLFLDPEISRRHAKRVVTCFRNFIKRVYEVTRNDRSRYYTPTFVLHFRCLGLKHIDVVKYLGLTDHDEFVVRHDRCCIFYKEYEQIRNRIIVRYGLLDPFSDCMYLSIDNSEVK